LFAIQVEQSIVWRSLAFCIVYDVDVVLELLHELLPIHKVLGRRLLLSLVGRALTYRGLWLAKHGKTWGSDRMDFLLVINETRVVTRLATDAEAFTRLSFLLFNLDYTAFALFINLAHLFLLLLQISFLFFGQHGLICHYGSVHSI
jgi:hypothetical protein